MHVLAEHIPGVLNLRADKESRIVSDLSDLEIESDDVPVTGTEVGALGSRSVHVATHMPIATVCELETRLLGDSSQCLYDEMEIKGYAFPPFALSADAYAS